MISLFFISEIPKDAQFIEEKYLRHLLKREEFLKTVQFLDPRTQLPTTYSIHQFEIKDKQLSKQQNPILVGISLFQMKTRVRQPFSDFLNGVKDLIHYYRSQPDYTLTVFVGDSAWDPLHKADCLKSDHVNFVRMVDSSSYSRIGQCWRYLVFDSIFDNIADSFAAVEDTDIIGNKRIKGRRYKVKPLNEFESAFRHVGGAYSFVFPVHRWEPIFRQRDMLEVSLCIHNHPPLFWGNRYNKSPVNVAKTLARRLHSPISYTVYYASYNVWTYFKVVERTNRLLAVQHTWHFFTSAKYAMQIKRSRVEHLVTHHIGRRMLRQCHDEGHAVLYRESYSPVFDGNGNLLKAI